MSAADDSVSRLRVAVLNRSFVSTGGGAERYSIALVEQLASRHEVHVFAQQIEHSWPGVHYHRLWTPLSRPRWINQLWFALSSWWATRTGFDVVHSHENTWHGQVQTVHVLPVKYTLFHGSSGLRLVLTWLKVMSSPRLLVYLWLERLRYRPLSNRLVVVTSPALKSVMVETYPQTTPMLEVLTPGVSRVVGVTSLKDQFTARSSLALPAQGRCVLFVANDYKKKGLPALLQALRLLSDETYLAVVGNASHIAAFKGMAEKCSVDTRVFFLGPQRNMDVAYRAADCLAHPTLEDTFAMVVLEGMSHGLPVVVSNARYCGISSLLVNKDQALILDDPQDPTELAELIQKTLSDKDIHLHLVQSGLKFALAYLWSEIATRQDNIYASVVSRKNGTKAN